MGFSTSWGSETTQPMKMKFCTVDYVGELIPRAKVACTKGVFSGRRGEVDTLCAFLFVVEKCGQRPMHQNTCFGGGYISSR